MREIQMVDLKAQYHNLKSAIDSAIKDVIESAAFIKGPEIKLFEEELKKYMGTKHVVTCANGTDALYLAMMAMELKPGDEVITTNFTFIATIEAAAVLNLKPVIVEPDPSNFNISVDSIRKAITPKTRAIIPVHLFGQCADMESIMSIAREHNLFVIEDAAQATGADYIFKDGKTKKAGTIGHIGTTSFFPSKNLGCYGDGGALYTNDDHIAERLRSIANHGMKDRYFYKSIGINSRLDSIQAAILRVKLQHLTSFNERRRNAADYYDNAFAKCSSISVPERVSYSSHIFHQYTIKIHDGKRDELKEFLKSRNIPSMIYYPEPLHLQEAYKYLGYGVNDFPVTGTLCKEVLSLPMHPELESEQLNYISDNVLSFFNS